MSQAKKSVKGTFHCYMLMSGRKITFAAYFFRNMKTSTLIQDWRPKIIRKYTQLIGKFVYLWMSLKAKYL